MIVSEFEKDALRYRWIRQFLRVEPVYMMDQNKLIKGNFYWSIGEYPGVDIDGAIDKAIKGGLSGPSEWSSLRG
jgi:hypothetical protein